MASKENPKQAKIDKYIDENLKQVFANFEADQMPTEITDLLSVLRAQDEEMRSKK